MLFVFFNTGASAQAFHIETGLTGSFVRLVDGSSAPEGGLSAVGLEAGASLFWKNLFGASVLGLFSFPIRESASTAFQIQLLLGPSFQFRWGNWALAMTPAFYCYFLPNNSKPVAELGVGAHVAAKYHFNQLLYMYGRVTGAFSFSQPAKDFAIAPALGVGFKINDKYGRQPAPAPAVQPAAVPETATERTAAEEPQQTAPPPQQTAPVTQQQTAPVAAPQQAAPQGLQPEPTAITYSAQGLAAYNAKNWDAAVAAYTRALQLDPDNATRQQSLATALSARGLTAYNARNWEDAITDFTEALRHNPNNATVKQSLAAALSAKALMAYNNRDWDAAVTIYAQALELVDNAGIKQSLAAAHGARGLVAYSAKNWDAAVADFTEALRLDPNTASRKQSLITALSARGLAAYNAKDWDAAVADFTEALRLDPSNATTQRNLSLSLRGKQQ